MFSARKKLVMCQVCRGLIEASARSCPLCGRDSIPAARIKSASLTESGNFFSLVLLTINIVLFVLMSIVEVRNGGSGDAFIKSASSGVLNDFGALVPSMVRAGQWWRLVTFNFLHIGLMHLMFNSLALFTIGPRVEDIFGPQKFVFAYIGTGTASAFVSYLLLPNDSAGASGAIFGLIGLMAVCGYRLGGSFGRDLMRQMLIWGAIGIMLGFFMGANNAAHVGGFVAGAALGFVLQPEAPSTASSAARWNAAAIACVVLVAVSFAMAGRVYGSEQEKFVRRANTDRRHDLAYELATKMRDAWRIVGESFDLKIEPGKFTRNDAIEIASSMRRIAGDLEKAPVIDDRIGAIKNRLIELTNKRAKSFDEAVDERSMTAAVSENREAFIVTFKDFAEWESDAAREFNRRPEQ
jgi:membrane associated rhomboid family serine protease